MQIGAFSFSGGAEQLLDLFAHSFTNRFASPNLHKFMANEKNLKPFSELTEKEQREIRRKGGVASGKKRREKKTFKELLKIALEMSTKSGNTNAEEIVASMILKAQSGDVKAFEAIRDTIGEKPKDNVDLTTREEIPEGATALYAKIKAAYGNRD